MSGRPDEDDDDEEEEDGHANISNNYLLFIIEDTLLLPERSTCWLRADAADRTDGVLGCEK